MALDTQSQKYLYELLGEAQANQLLVLPLGVFEDVLKNKIRQRGLYQNKGPRYSLALREVNNGT